MCSIPDGKLTDVAFSLMHSSFPALSSPSTQEVSLAVKGCVHLRIISDQLTPHCTKASLSVEYASLRVPKNLDSSWPLTLGWLCPFICLQPSCHFLEEVRARSLSTIWYGSWCLVIASCGQNCLPGPSPRPGPQCHLCPQMCWWPRHLPSCQQFRPYAIPRFSAMRLWFISKASCLSCSACCAISSLATLEVMMKMASLQSMVFPFPSVSRPWERTVTAWSGS